MKDVSIIFLKDMRYMEDKINELEKQLKESAERRKVFKEEGYTEGEAKEASRFAEITEEIAKLREEEKREIERKAKIAELEKELKDCAERRKIFKEEGYIEGEAQENSRFAELTQKINDLSENKEIDEEDVKKEESAKKVEKVEDIDDLKSQLSECSKRMKEFKNDGNIEGEAQENSRYVYLVEKLREAGVEEDFSLPISSEEVKKEEKKVSYIEKAKGFIKKIGEKINKFIGKIKEKVKSVFSKKEKSEEVEEEEKSTIDKKTIEFREALKAKENSKTSMRSIDIAADAIIKPLDKNDGLEK